MNETQDAAALDLIEEDQQFQDLDSTSKDESFIQDSSITQSSNPIEDSQIIADVLAANGIQDVDKIKFEENGQLIERSWNELSREEKKNILSSTNQVDPDAELDDEEIDFINQLRLLGKSPSSFINDLRTQMAQVSDNQNPDYDIDSYSDDELFMYDTIARYGDENITDDQIRTLLENAQADPDLYNKTIQNLRTFYRKQEDEYRYRKQQEEEAAMEAEYDNFSDTIVNEIASLQDLAGQEISLTRDDKNELANFILNKDENGSSEFGKLMDDPRVFVQLALWALKGPQVMSAINDQKRRDYNREYQETKSTPSYLAFRSKDNKGNKDVKNSAFGLDVY